MSLEQKMLALDRANWVRRHRAAAKKLVESRHPLAVADLVEQGDERLQHLPVEQLLAALRRVGPRWVEVLIEAARVPGRAPVGSLTACQRSRLATAIRLAPGCVGR